MSLRLNFERKLPPALALEKPRLYLLHLSALGATGIAWGLRVFHATGAFCQFFSVRRNTVLSLDYLRSLLRVLIVIGVCVFTLPFVNSL